MKNILFCLLLLISTTALADASVDLVSISVDAGTVVVPSLDEPITSAKGFYVAVKTGNGWLAAMFMLFFLVGFIRIVGKWIHGMIPDDTKNWFLAPVERVLFFIFDTKIGGWIMNWLSAIGGCLSTAAMAGMPVDAASWKVALLASTGGTALIELKDDVMEWWAKRKVAKKLAEEEELAKKAAVVSPSPIVALTDAPLTTAAPVEIPAPAPVVEAAPLIVAEPVSSKPPKKATKAKPPKA